MTYATNTASRVADVRSNPASLRANVHHRPLDNAAKFRQLSRLRRIWMSCQLSPGLLQSARFWWWLLLFLRGGLLSYVVGRVLRNGWFFFWFKNFFVNILFRYIVNKGYRSQPGQTPMTSRPPASPAMEQCEITIENCCNMNICETVGGLCF